jgi:hypothetical protein
MRRILFLIAPLLLLSCTEIPQGQETEAQQPQAAASSASAQAPAPAPVEVPVPTPSARAFDPLAVAAGIALPDRVHLDVPFTPQSPYADWNPPFDEACEEVSLIMAEFALRGEDLPQARAAQEIRDLAAWVDDAGYAVDVTVAELAAIARERFGRKAIVYEGEDVNIENMQRLLAAGYPVIVPAAGQHIGNPYFSGDGPPYHMLALIGYEDGGMLSGLEFITNEPGTRRGENYRYSADVIDKVIHDWNGSKETILSGKRAILVIGE